MKLCSTLLLNFARSEKINVHSVEKPLPKEYNELPNDRFFGSVWQSAQNHVQGLSLAVAKTNLQKLYGDETCEDQFRRLRHRDNCTNENECGHRLGTGGVSTWSKYDPEGCERCKAKLSAANAATKAGTDNGEKTWRNAYIEFARYNYGDGNRSSQDLIYFVDYGNNANCYQKFASECKYGVHLNMREMRIEARQSTNDCPYDHIAFAYEKNGQMFYPGKQQRFCGCLESMKDQCAKIRSEDLDVFNLRHIFKKTNCVKQCFNPKMHWISRHEPVFGASNKMKPSFSTTSRLDRKQKLITIHGRNPYFLFKSDRSLYGGEIAIEWKCMSEFHNRWSIYYDLPALGGNPRRQSVSRTTIANDMKQALQKSMKLINPYGEADAETKVSVRLSDDETKFITELEFNGIRDENIALDAKTISRQVAETAKATLSTDQFNKHVDASNISVKVQSPPTVTNTEQMAEKLLTDKFTPAMAENYGCSTPGYFDAFGPTHGKPRDAVDVALSKWKKCVQCASGYNKNNIAPYDYDESEKICRGENRALCECDLALMTHLKTAEPYKGDFDATTCVAAEHQVMLECCNWQQHYWAAYNPDRQDCDELEGVKEAGSL